MSLELWKFVWYVFRTIFVFCFLYDKDIREAFVWIFEHISPHGKYINCHWNHFLIISGFIFWFFWSIGVGFFSFCRRTWYRNWWLWTSQIATGYTGHVWFWSLALLYWSACDSSINSQYFSSDAWLFLWLLWWLECWSMWEETMISSKKIDWLIGWLVGWLVGWTIDWLNDWFTNWFIHLSIDQFFLRSLRVCNWVDCSTVDSAYWVIGCWASHTPLPASRTPLRRYGTCSAQIHPWNPVICTFKRKFFARNSPFLECGIRKRFTVWPFVFLYF